MEVFLCRGSSQQQISPGAPNLYSSLNDHVDKCFRCRCSDDTVNSYSVRNCSSELGGRRAEKAKPVEPYWSAPETSLPTYELAVNTSTYTNAATTTLLVGARQTSNHL